MKMIKYLIVAGLTALTFSPAHAFIGKRAGLVFGAGLGYFNLPSENSSNSKTIHFKFGIGFTNKNVLAFEMIQYDRRDVAFWSGNVRKEISGTFDKKLYFLSWYHYLSASTSSWFWEVGIGKYHCEHYINPILDSPYSLMISGGYEYCHIEGKISCLYVAGDKYYVGGYGQVKFGVMIGATLF